MRFTDIFIERPVLSIVVSAFILVLGIRAVGILPIQQYPSVKSAVITVTTSYIGADPSTITAFITTPLENAIAQANGIDYMTSNSSQNTSTIQANLLLNYDPDKALTEVTTQVNSVLNQLPRGSQLPAVSINVGESIDSMYLGFYSKELSSNKINDYLLRAVQPRLQAINGVQQATILGDNQFAMRIWLNPEKLAGYGISPAEIKRILEENNFISAAGRTDGQTFVLNFTAGTDLRSVEGFHNMVIKAEKGAIIRLKEVATIALGSQNYNSSVFFNDQQAVYIGIIVTPGANLLTVVSDIKKVFNDIKVQLPVGIEASIVYDASAFVKSSITEVNRSLLEAFTIVTVVIFLFLGSFRALLIPVITIPLSIVGTFFIMLILSYSINLLTLLAFVLGIGLVVDDAIIVVENVERHIEEGETPQQAALLSARELTMPIVAITVVLIAVYLPIGFMSGLVGALFTEFAFTLASAVAVSAIIALTLSPMMCSQLLVPGNKSHKKNLVYYINQSFNKMMNAYRRTLDKSLHFLPVTVTFATIVLFSNYFLFITSQSELAPQEDQGVILNQVTTAANSSLDETAIYSAAVSKIYTTFPETMTTFQINGSSGAISSPTLNADIGGMVFKLWDERKRTTNQLQPIIQKKANDIAGAKTAIFQPASLPGGGAGLPIQFVIQTTDSFELLNEVVQNIVQKALSTGAFIYLDPDLKYDQLQTVIELNRDKIAEFGLNMQEIGDSLSAVLSENYINYFDYMGRSYQVIPQVYRQSRLNADQVLHYYITTAKGQAIQLSTVATLREEVVPESINHFQQLNSATLSAVAAPGISMGEALQTLRQIALSTIPQGYTIDYGAQSRQYVHESSALVITFVMSLIVIFLSLSALFNSFRDPFIVLISVPLSICGAMIFISMGVGGATLNIYTEVGLVTLIGLISKHGILIVQFANDLQRAGKSKWEAILSAASIRFRPILMTTAAMVLGVVPLIMATGAGAVSRFNIGLVIATGISIGTLFTFFVVPAMYLLIAKNHQQLAQH
ncbi:MAG: multidrug efflux protein [Gammaproteobacteria bacterium RIFCSPHIGHO2_12_FULL_41_15]|nr:MAG: multidrug efflux protein [Gammaproteobacteria bacterium RIFCSPHIGHO2_12_FULL_41_15]